jgi:hypothetical protein
LSAGVASISGATGNRMTCDEHRAPPGETKKWGKVIRTANIKLE